MKKYLIILFVFVLSYNKHTPAQSNQVELYILAGQSNTGRARTSEMSVIEVANYTQVIANAKILNPSVSRTVLQNFQPGVNTMLYDEIASDEFGCEASLFKHLPAKTRYLLKFGSGGTSMQADWSALANRPLWDSLKTYTNNIVSAIVAEGKIPVLKAFIWMQGESDGGSESFANNYLTRLQGFFDAYKVFWDDIVSDSSWSPQTYKVVIGRIQDFGSFSGTVRTAQSDFCSIPANNAVLIDTDNYPMRDASHFSATGQIKFGVDILNAIQLPPRGSFIP